MGFGRTICFSYTAGQLTSGSVLPQTNLVDVTCECDENNVPAAKCFCKVNVSDHKISGRNCVIVPCFDIKVDLTGNAFTVENEGPILLNAKLW